MAELTPNYGLEKATENEFYDVRLHARNMDKIDAQLKNNADAAAAVGDAIAAHKAESMPHQFTDGVTFYKWGLSVVNGILMFNYEEV